MNEERNERVPLQRLAWALTAINLVLLLALAVAAFYVVGKVRAVEDRLESFAAVIKNFEGGDEIMTLIDDVNPRSEELNSIESRLSTIEVAVGSLSPSGGDTDGDGVLLQVFPELQFDAMLSDECVSSMREDIRLRDYSTSDRRAHLQRIEEWRSYPYSQFSDNTLSEIGRVIDDLAYSRGWTDWQGNEYGRYERSYDESGGGASAPLPCIDERKQLSMFQSIRDSNPMGRFREDLVEDHWECARRISSGDDDDDDQQIGHCKAFNALYSQWLPPLPTGTSASRGSGDTASRGTATATPVPRHVGNGGGTVAATPTPTRY